ncbi:hypothetical protein [Ewingella americana]|uniref:Uncharacterized protein n=1 Tax=Ewingella americana TaxID=41202 RepID=A0A502GEM2_9GAMM|nr:hypothetical protein [Ewingella americana]TPG59988.1 hypothetical protein EAH77_15590 [Ewingella americana]
MTNKIIGDEKLAEPLDIENPVNAFLHQADVNTEALITLFATAFDLDYKDVLESDHINTDEARRVSRELSEQRGTNVNDLHMLIRSFYFDAKSTGHVIADIVQRVTVNNIDQYLVGSSKIGMNFDEEFLKGIDVELAENIMKTVSIAHATNTFAFRVGTIYNDIALEYSDIEFIENTSNATSSWFKAANGLEKCKLVWLHEPETNLHMLPNIKLDFDQCVLGASSGKESTFNRYILEDSGYKVHGVTFKNVEDIHSEGATMELICLDDENLSYMYLYPLTVQPRDKTLTAAFDAQGVISVPRYAMLIIEALKKGAGNLAVGTEFGCSKIWYPHDPENAVKGKTIHDMAVDEGAYVCQQIEAFFKSLGIEIYIIAPTAVLHEVGILRALVEIKGFDLAKLKSCWRANYLQHNYCGVCYKCQRLARYYRHLNVKHPTLGFNKFIDYADLGFASGSMLSYSMQYHIFEDHQELPWDRAICIDNESLKLLDYRTGNRILNKLVLDYGFDHTILTSLYANTNQIRLNKSQNIIDALKAYTDIDLFNMLKANPIKLNNCFLELPGEKEFRDSLTTDQKAELVEAGCDLGVLISHIDKFPIFVEGEEGLGHSWKWVTLQRNDESLDSDPITLRLSQKSLDNVLVRRWLSAKSVLGGLDYYKIKYTM